MSSRPSSAATAQPDIAELKRQLSELLSLEETDSDVDWTAVSTKAQALLPYWAEFPEFVVHYLTEVDRRQSDPVFAHAQRTGLLSFLRSAN